MILLCNIVKSYSFLLAGSATSLLATALLALGITLMHGSERPLACLVTSLLKTLLLLGGTVLLLGYDTTMLVHDKVVL